MNARLIQQMVGKAREKFLSLDGVLGVGYGMKWIGGEETETPALVVYVEEKLAREAVPEDQLLPTTFEDWPVDVQEVSFDQERVMRDESGNREGGGMTEWLDWGKIHRLNMEQKERQGRARRIKRMKPDGSEEEVLDFTSPAIDMRGDLFVIDDDGSLAYTTSGGDRILDMVGAWNLFRTRFGDDYDFATFLLAHDTAWDDTGTPNMGNASNTIYRASSDNGYGIGAENHRADWGGSSRLQRWVYHSWYTARTMLHEPGHQWLFYVNYRDSQNGPEQGLLHENWNSAWSASQKPFHPGGWPDNDRSCMDYDHLDWFETTPGTPGTYGREEPQDTEFVFCPLDQYLMGFLNPEATSSSRVRPPTYPVSGSDFQIIKDPKSNPNGTFSSTPVAITAQNIIWNEGARTPNLHSSQRVFHQAMIAITSNVNTYAAFLTAVETRRHDQIDNWRRATSGRSVMDTSLLRANVNDVYIRDTLTDTGVQSSASSGTFWNSPDLFVRNADDNPTLYLNPALGDSIHQKPLSNQDNWLYARVHNKSNTSYDNVTVRFYLANYLGFDGHDTVAEAVPRTEVFYPIDWHPTRLIGTAVLATVPAGGTAVAKVLWPKALVPPQANWHPCLLAEVFPLGTTPEKLHHVWENRKLAQKNLEIIYITGDAQNFVIPFEIGHAFNLHHLEVLEILKEGPWQDVAVYLNPGAALRRVREIEGIPFISFQRQTLVQPEEKRFAEQLRAEALKGCWPHGRPLPVGGQRSELWPLQGFQLQRVGRANLLTMVDPQFARLPVGLGQIAQRQMQLKLVTPKGGLKTDVMVHLVQRNSAGIIVGGIDVQLRSER